MIPPTLLKSIVVLYRFSTSNHNSVPTFQNMGEVVLYRFSTSNHNYALFPVLYHKLYYIVSLHQTTTEWHRKYYVLVLYYIVSLHQTTTFEYFCSVHFLLYYIVSLHQTTTRVATAE